MTDSFPGRWNQQDHWVISIPALRRRAVESVHVEEAVAQVIGIDPGAFYVLIPKEVPRANLWRVDIKGSVLQVRPPKQSGAVDISITNIVQDSASVDMQAGVVYGNVSFGGGVAPRIQQVRIGIFLPRDMPVT